MPLPEPPPRRLLALDPGARRVGVAVSDELGAFAHARPAIVAADQVAAVERLVTEEAIAEVIVGLPLALSGGETDQTRTARAFAARLRGQLSVPVTEWDERLSSVQAGRRLEGSAQARRSSSAGARRRASGELDSAAAAVILQTVLDARRRQART